MKRIILILLLLISVNSIAQITQKNGNIGISKPIPAYKLDVKGTINATEYKLNGVTKEFSQWTLTNNKLNYKISNDYEGDSAFTIFDNPGGLNVIRINTLDQTIVFDDAEAGDYNVGINTKTPDYILDVNGTTRFGTSSNHTSTESDGTLVFTGDATVYDDLMPNSVSVGGGSSAPSFTVYNGGNLRAYEFIGASTTKDINMTFQMSHSYKEGSNIEPHLHLYIPSASTGDIKFTLTYTWQNVSATGVVSETVTSATYTVPATTVQQNRMISLGTVAGTGKTISSIFSCNIKRDPTDAADTFTSSVWLLGADIHYEINTIGSRTTTAK